MVIPDQEDPSPLTEAEMVRLQKPYDLLKGKPWRVPNSPPYPELLRRAYELGYVSYAIPLDLVYWTEAGHELFGTVSFRAAGYTLNARKYPLSKRGVAWVRKYNNIPDGHPIPWTWEYAPNEACLP